MAATTVSSSRWNGTSDHRARPAPHTGRGSRLRILLDATLWNRIGECHEEQAFEALEGSFSLETVLAPSVLLEVLESPAPELRDRAVHAMTNLRRTCLPTEASQCAEEFVNEAARLRPGWLRSFPLTDRLAPLENFWSKRVWVNARRDSAAGHLAVAKRERKRSESSEGAGFLDRFAGEEPDAIEAWRLDSAARYWNELGLLGAGEAADPGLEVTLRHWVSPWVSIEQVRRDRADFDAFWYDEVDRSQMVRNWIFSCCDGPERSHLTHLPDTDVLLTGELGLAAAGKALRGAAPSWLPPTLHVPHLPGGVVAGIESVLKSDHELRGRLPRS